MARIAPTSFTVTVVKSLPCLLSLLIVGFIVVASQLQGEMPEPRPPRPNEVIDAPLPPAEAAQTMQVPEGFQVTLFAGEPDVQQPIGMCIDDRGRVWVAEAYNYPLHGTRPGDRIVILEDSDHDGRADRRTVFYDQLNYVTGIEVGFGGAWVMSPPYFYFIPDRDGDDRPDGPPEVLLDGFGNHANAHNLANGFAWGPDGWLYGTHGRTNWSKLGKPGTPEEERIVFDGGVYRYHPTRHVWEPYADGTTNPWGIDWNDYGEAFICNCVNPHLFHVIYGAHYEPWRNRESSRYAYERIPTIADHLHFVGGDNVRTGFGSVEEDAAGGGHAHCGTMVYLGDNWPERYRNSLFTNNIHGRRINNDRLTRHGSGYVGSHAPDIMRSRDPWYMGVTLLYGPDGSVFASDWSDTGECHSTRNTKRHTGRIYKISHGQPKSRAVDLAKLSDPELVQLQSHRNDWYVRHARRLLQERSQSRDMTNVAAQLRAMFERESDVPRQLRALWALHAIGQLNEASLLETLSHDNESVRGWGIQLLCESAPFSPEALTHFARLAKDDPSPLVRLHLASMLQRLPTTARGPIVQALLTHAEDADDDNLPLMIWYGLEPLVHDNLEQFLQLAVESRLLLVSQFCARRVAELPGNGAALDAMIQRLPAATGAVQLASITGLLEGLAGQRSVTRPASWAAVYPQLQASADDALRESSLQLALVFDDPAALEMLRSQAINSTLTGTLRNRAIAALVAKQARGFSTTLLELVQDPVTRRTALRGLAEFDDPQTVDVILRSYPELDSAARQDAVQTLTARVPWALRLMDAVEANRIHRADITAYSARQMLSLGDKSLTVRLENVWGKLRATPAEKQKLMADYKKRLTTASMETADRRRGRAVFHKVCANCHRFFDAGGAIGPNITGSQRTNLDYLLETILDPSAAVSRDFQMHIVETSSGRVISGLIVNETDAAVTMQTANERLVVPKDEIEDRTLSPVSMMPEGMLQNLSNDEVRSLFAYLMGAGQVPLPADVGGQ